ncbi:hypothetical protein Agub_g13610 [Astrephomene gubernaculifera]|uniref:Uncharacterized protein n=1 Tax=Astrephomene gubernaculifera TaxID=47775 RepID=A0AAD3E027_9CHLO|nr:hypothetical protein Agub_g13610 [Astrephomene gubernaculifera]
MHCSLAVPRAPGAMGPHAAHLESRKPGPAVHPGPVRLHMPSVEELEGPVAGRDPAYLLSFDGDAGDAHQYRPWRGAVSSTDAGGYLSFDGDSFDAFKANHHAGGRKCAPVAPQRHPKRGKSSRTQPSGL